MEPIGLYFHIPFCVAKCPYCDFYSLPASEEVMDRYTDALLRSISLCPYPAERADTVYFGGGTPILLGPRRLNRILEKAAQTFSLTPDAEITLEANPHSTLLEALQALRSGGFNRISFGVQSAVSSQLGMLGRRHTAKTAQQAVEQSRRAGFSNISVDMMLGLPGQTPEDAAVTARFCTGLEVEHISAYLLKIEPATPFAQRYREEDLDEEVQAEIYLQTVKQLGEAGYRQYEISNFAKPGRESRHNLKYWNCDHYLGFGPSAHSYYRDRRFAFPRDLEGFCGLDNPWALSRQDGQGGSFEEYAMLRLRLTDGLVFADLRARYPQVDPAPYLARAARLRGHGLLVQDSDHLALTPQGMLLSNAILAQILL